MPFSTNVVQSICKDADFLKTDRVERVEQVVRAGVMRSGGGANLHMQRSKYTN